MALISMKLSARLEELAQSSTYIPFDLDVLRAIGFTIGLDWDGEVLVEPPESIDPEKMADLILRFKSGTAIRLGFEGYRARSVCVGGPRNNTPHNTYRGTPLIFHVARAEWAVYCVVSCDDPRALYVGTATNKVAARAMWHRANLTTVKDDCDDGK